MTFRLDHIHIKCADVSRVLSFFVEAFRFSVLSDEVRPSGDRFVRCQPEAGDTLIILSDRREGETLDAASGEPRYGLDHFGIQSEDLDADVARLQELGATLAEGPLEIPGGIRVAFLKAPGDVRIELLQRPAATAV